MAKYENEPARGSLIKVLNQAIREMEKAEFALRAAHMIESGRWPKD